MVAVSTTRLMCSQQPLPSQGGTCVQSELLGGLTAKTNFEVAMCSWRILASWPTSAPRCPLQSPTGNCVNRSRGHRSVLVVSQKNSMHMRALPSGGNLVVAALDALGHEAISGGLGHTVMIHWWNASTLNDVICSRPVLSMPCVEGFGSCGRRFSSGFVCVAMSSWSSERKAQDAFLTEKKRASANGQLLQTPMPPSLVEVKRHHVTSHTLPSARRCEQCLMARAPDAPALHAQSKRI